MSSDSQSYIVRRSSRISKRTAILKRAGLGLFLVFGAKIKVPRVKNRLLLIALCSLLFAGLAPILYTRAGTPARVYAAASNNLNFQARLLTGAGAIVPDGNYSVQFNLYNVSSGGITQWTETQGSVAVRAGYLSVYLGSVTPFPSTIDWSQQQWLTMNVNGDGEMTPRLKLTAVPNALHANEADALRSGSNLLTADNFAQLAPSTPQVINSALAALRLNQTGAGLLAQLQGNGADVFTIAKNGDLTSGGSAVFSGGTLTLGGANGIINTTGGGNLTLSPNGSGILILNTGSSGLITTNASTIRRIASGSTSIDLQDASDTTFAFSNSGTGNLNLTVDGIISAGTLGAASNAAYLCRNVSGQLASCGTTGTGVAFLNGGNVFGGLATLGTTDTNDLAFITGGTERWRITTAGILQSSAAQTIQTSSGALTLLANSASLSVGGTSGNVGIGTLTPGFKLDVAGDIGLSGDVVGSGGLNANFKLRGTSNGRYVQVITSPTGSTLRGFGSTSNGLTLGGGSNDQLLLDGSGNVGIGTTSPGALLAVGTGAASNFKVNASGDITSSFTLLDGSTTTSGSSGLTPPSTSLTVTSSTNFDVGNYVQISDTNCGGTGVNPCYAKITAIAGNVLTITPGLTWTTGKNVKEYHIPELGGVDTTQALANRYGRGYFISGVAAGNGTTYYNENSIETSLTSFDLLNTNVTTLNIGGAATTLKIGNASGTITIAGNVTFSGNVTAPTTGTSGYLSRNSGILQPASSGDSFTTTGNIYTTGSGTITSAGLLTVSAGGANITGGLTLATGALSLSSGGITNAGSIGGVAGLTFTSGSLNLSNGGITNAGSIAGVTTLTASGQIYVPGTSGTSGQGFFTGTAATHLGGLQSLDLGGNTYSFLGNNKYYTGSGWADNGLGRVGSSFQIQNDAFTFYSFDTGTAFTPRFTVASGGNVGIGLSGAPAGLLSVGGSTGNFQVSSTGAISGVGLTSTGAAINLNNNSNFAVNIATGTSTGPIAIGGSSASLAINSTGFDVTSAGAVSGVTTLTASGNVNTTGGSYQSQGATGLTLAACTAGQYIGNGAKVTGGIITAGSCRNDAGLSDVRLKKDIASVGSVLDKVAGVNVVTFDFRVDEFPALNLDHGLQYGVIAQELEQIFPELVTTRDDGYKEVNFKGLSFYTLKAVTELAAKVDSITPGAGSNEIKTDGVLRLSHDGTLQNITGFNVISGGATIAGGINNSGGGITNIGAVLGATTISAQNLVLNANSSDNLLTLSKDGNGVFTVFNNGALGLQTDAANAFGVKTAAGISIFNIDTQNGKVVIGSGNAAKTVLFILDSRSTVDDPAGINGASYYNAAAGRFRCYQDNRWQDCLPAGDLTTSIASSKVSWQQPSADQEFPDTPRVTVSLTRAHEFRLNIRVTEAGAAGASCRLQYAMNDNGPWNDLMGGGTNQLAIDHIGTLKTDWVKIADAARVSPDTIIRVMCKAGDATITPVFYGVSLQIR